MSILAIRHPKVLNPTGVCYGRLDIPLDQGHLKSIAHELQAELDRFKPMYFYSSPSLRCIELAKTLTSQIFCIDQRIAEMNFGQWEGRVWGDIPHQEIDAWAKNIVNYAPPNGESFRNLCDRLEDFLRDLNPHQPIVLLTHSGILKALAHINGEKDAVNRQFSFGQAYYFKAGSEKSKII